MDMDTPIMHKCKDCYYLLRYDAGENLHYMLCANRMPVETYAEPRNGNLKGFSEIRSNFDGRTCSKERTDSNGLFGGLIFKDRNRCGVSAVNFTPKVDGRCISVDVQDGVYRYSSFADRHRLEKKSQL